MQKGLAIDKTLTCHVNVLRRKNDKSKRGRGPENNDEDHNKNNPMVISDRRERIQSK